MPIVPHRFLFRFSIPVAHVPGVPRKRGQLLDLPETCLLPDVGELDQAQPFAQLSAGWNENGLGFSLTMTGKSHPPECRVEAPDESDGLQLWIDTRNTQSIHRASRFCHHFCVLPAGGGKKREAPVAMQLPIVRAKEETAIAKPEQLPVWCERLSDGYRLEVWLPAEVLNGFEPQSNPRLGFYYLARDAELGEQFLTVGRDFPFSHDPSVWSTVELQSVTERD